MHALLIERDAGNALLTNELLDYGGFTLSWIRTSEHVREALLKKKPDVVLLSARPSVPSTLSVIDEIRTVEEKSALGRLPILVMSAEDPDEASVRSKEAGADAFLSIPFSSAALLSAAIPLALATALGEKPLAVRLSAPGHKSPRRATRLRSKSD